MSGQPSDSQTVDIAIDTELRFTDVNTNAQQEDVTANKGQGCTRRRQRYVAPICTPPCVIEQIKEKLRMLSQLHSDLVEPNQQDSVVQEADRPANSFKQLPSTRHAESTTRLDSEAACSSNDIPIDVVEQLASSHLERDDNNTGTDVPGTDVHTAQETHEPTFDKFTNYNLALETDPVKSDTEPGDISNESSSKNKATRVDCTKTLEDDNNNQTVINQTSVDDQNHPSCIDQTQAHDQKKLTQNNKTPVVGQNNSAQKDQTPTPTQSNETQNDQIPADDQNTQIPIEQIPVDDQNTQIPIEQIPVDDQNTQIPIEQIPVDDQNTQIPIEQIPVDDQNTQIPIEQIPADDQNTQIPIEQIPADDQHTQIPIEQIPVDDQNTQIPIEQIPVDDQNTQIPIEQIPVDDQNTQIPIEQIPVDDQNTQIPIEQIPVDDQNTQIPIEQIPVDDQNTQIPIEQIPVDDQKTQIPIEQIPADDQNTQIPIEQIPVDDQNTQIPIEQIPVDDQNTQIPIEQIPVDDQNTQIPIEQIPADDQNTQIPIEQIPVDDQKTQIPIEQIPADDQNTQIPIEQIPVDDQKTQIPIEQIPADDQNTQIPIEQIPVDDQKTQIPIEQIPADDQNTQIPIEQIPADDQNDYGSDTLFQQLYENDSTPSFTTSLPHIDGSSVANESDTPKSLETVTTSSTQTFGSNITALSGTDTARLDEKTFEKGSDVFEKTFGSDTYVSDEDSIEMLDDQSKKGFNAMNSNSKGSSRETNYNLVNLVFPEALKEGLQYYNDIYVADDENKATDEPATPFISVHMKSKAIEEKPDSVTDTTSKCDTITPYNYIGKVNTRAIFKKSSTLGPFRHHHQFEENLGHGLNNRAATLDRMAEEHKRQSQPFYKLMPTPLKGADLENKASAPMKPDPELSRTIKRLNRCYKVTKMMPVRNFKRPIFVANSYSQYKLGTHVKQDIEENDGVRGHAEEPTIIPEFVQHPAIVTPSLHRREYPVRTVTPFIRAKSTPVKKERIVIKREPVSQTVITGTKRRVQRICMGFTKVFGKTDPSKTKVRLNVETDKSASCSRGGSVNIPTPLRLKPLSKPTETERSYTGPIMKAYGVPEPTEWSTWQLPSLPLPEEEHSPAYLYNIYKRVPEWYRSDTKLTMRYPSLRNMYPRVEYHPPANSILECKPPKRSRLPLPITGIHTTKEMRSSSCKSVLDPSLPCNCGRKHALTNTQFFPRNKKTLLTAARVIVKPELTNPMPVTSNDISSSDSESIHELMYERKTMPEIESEPELVSSSDSESEPSAELATVFMPPELVSTSDSESEPRPEPATVFMPPELVSTSDSESEPRPEPATVFMPPELVSSSDSESEPRPEPATVFMPQELVRASDSETEPRPELATVFMPPENVTLFERPVIDEQEVECVELDREPGTGNSWEPEQEHSRWIDASVPVTSLEEFSPRITEAIDETRISSRFIQRYEWSYESVPHTSLEEFSPRITEAIDETRTSSRFIQPYEWSDESVSDTSLEEFSPRITEAIDETRTSSRLVQAYEYNTILYIGIFIGIVLTCAAGPVGDTMLEYWIFMVTCIWRNVMYGSTLLPPIV